MAGRHQRWTGSRGYVGETCLLGGFHRWGAAGGVVKAGHEGTRLRCQGCGAFARHTTPAHIRVWGPGL